MPRKFKAWILLPDNNQKLIPSCKCDYAYIALTKDKLLSMGKIEKGLKACRVEVIEL